MQEAKTEEERNPFLHRGCCAVPQRHPVLHAQHICDATVMLPVCALRLLVWLGPLDLLEHGVHSLTRLLVPSHRQDIALAII